MEQKEFIQVMSGMQSVMISISSIAYVQPLKNGLESYILLKEKGQTGNAYFIESTTNYHTIVAEIENYRKILPSKD